MSNMFKYAVKLVNADRWIKKEDEQVKIVDSLSDAYVTSNLDIARGLVTEVGVRLSEMCEVHVFEVIHRGVHTDEDSKTKDKVHCSFCGKSQDDVEKVIAGPDVHICNECIKLCNDILMQEQIKDQVEELVKEKLQHYTIQGRLKEE